MMRSRRRSTRLFWWRQACKDYASPLCFRALPVPFAFHRELVEERSPQLRGERQEHTPHEPHPATQRVDLIEEAEDDRHRVVVEVERAQLVDELDPGDVDALERSV